MLSRFLLESPENKAARGRVGALVPQVQLNPRGEGARLAPKAGGFTLIEIMAAMVVFFIIMAMLAQMTKDTTVLVQRSNKGMDGDAQARRVFSLLARDLAGMPHRLDLDYSLFKHNGFTLPERYSSLVLAANAMPGNDSLVLVSNDSGNVVSGGPAMSLVVWKMGEQPGFKGPVLQRLRLPLVWEPGASGGISPIYLPNTILDRVPDVLTRTGDAAVAGEHVFRMEYQYWRRASTGDSAGMSVTPYKPGTTVVDSPLRQAASLVVTVAILDAESRKICGNLEALALSLPDAVEGGDTAEVWNGIIQSSGFASLAQIPQEAASGIRIYQRFLNLPSLE